MLQQEVYSLTHVVLLPKLFNLNQIIGNSQIYKNVLQHNQHVLFKKFTVVKDKKKKKQECSRI